MVRMRKAPGTKLLTPFQTGSPSLSCPTGTSVIHGIFEDGITRMKHDNWNPKGDRHLVVGRNCAGRIVFMPRQLRNSGGVAQKRVGAVYRSNFGDESATANIPLNMSKAVSEQGMHDHKHSHNCAGAGCRSASCSLHRSVDRCFNGCYGIIRESSQSLAPSRSGCEPCVFHSFPPSGSKGETRCECAPVPPGSGRSSPGFGIADTCWCVGTRA